MLSYFVWYKGLNFLSFFDGLFTFLVCLPNNTDCILVQMKQTAYVLISELQRCLFFPHFKRATLCCFPMLSEFMLS